jgi:hypothetical protein
MLRASREPDEETAVAGGTDVESETSWWTRLKMRNGKVKDS